MTENTLIYRPRPTSSDLVSQLRDDVPLTSSTFPPTPTTSGKRLDEVDTSPLDEQPNQSAVHHVWTRSNRNALNYPLPTPITAWLNLTPSAPPRRTVTAGALGMNEWDPGKARRRARKLLELLSSNRRELITLRAHWKAELDRSEQCQYWLMRIDMELDQRIKLLIAWRLAVWEGEGV